MRKNSTIIFFIISFSFIILSCSKAERKKSPKINELKSLVEYVKNSKTLRDSIKKLHSYDMELALCFQKKSKNYTIITIVRSCIPFYVNHEYYYEKIEGLDIIFYNWRKPLRDYKIQNGFEELIKKNIVIIKSENRLCCEQPYYKFIICNENPEIISCYDNVMMTALENDYRAKGKDMRNIESHFYPKCK